MGDSANDRDLLEAAGLRFFVGETFPAIRDAVHIPDADMEEIARRVIAAD